MELSAVQKNSTKEEKRKERASYKKQNVENVPEVSHTGSIPYRKYSVLKVSHTLIVPLVTGRSVLQYFSVLNRQ